MSEAINKYLLQSCKPVMVQSLLEIAMLYCIKGKKTQTTKEERVGTRLYQPVFLEDC